MDQKGFAKAFVSIFFGSGVAALHEATHSSKQVRESDEDTKHTQTYRREVRQLEQVVGLEEIVVADSERHAQAHQERVDVLDAFELRWP